MAINRDNVAVAKRQATQLLDRLASRRIPA
jgi:hypothetical protein